MGFCPGPRNVKAEILRRFTHFYDNDAVSSPRGAPPDGLVGPFDSFNGHYRLVLQEDRFARSKPNAMSSRSCWVGFSRVNTPGETRKFSMKVVDEISLIPAFSK